MGKTVLLTELIHPMVGQSRGVSLFCGIGERCREGEELRRDVRLLVDNIFRLIQAGYVPADDFTDPAAVQTFAHLSASIVLSRRRASEGLYPAIDPLQSSSILLAPGIVGERHYQLAQEIRRTLAEYEAFKDIIAMLSLAELSTENRALVGRACRLERFLTQPFAVTEAYTGRPGRPISRRDALEGCERILQDACQDLPEDALYMIGTLDEARGAGHAP